MLLFIEFFPIVSKWFQLGRTPPLFFLLFGHRPANQWDVSVFRSFVLGVRAFSTERHRTGIELSRRKKDPGLLDLCRRIHWLRHPREHHSGKPSRSLILRCDYSHVLSLSFSRTHTHTHTHKVKLALSFSLSLSCVGLARFLLLVVDPFGLVSLGFSFCREKK